MLGYLFDLLFVAVVVAVAYGMPRNSLVHAAAFCVALLIASLLAITTFEPAAIWVERKMLAPSDFLIAMYLYFPICLGIFALALAGLVWCILRLLPDAPEMARRVETIGGWICSAFAGYLFASFLLVALQTFPAPREYWGAFAPEAHRRPGPIMALAPDYQFLALAEITCEHALVPLGGDWRLGRPVISADVEGGRWSSFPVRYAIWRELHQWRWGVGQHESEQTSHDLKRRHAVRQLAYEGHRRAASPVESSHQRRP